MNLVVLVERPAPAIREHDPSASLVARLDATSAIIATDAPERWGFRPDGVLLPGLHVPAGFRAWPARDTDQARRLVEAWRWGSAES